jgi:hypothetical protein
VGRPHRHILKLEIAHPGHVSAGLDALPSQNSDPSQFFRRFGIEPSGLAAPAGRSRSAPRRTDVLQHLEHSLGRARRLRVAVLEAMQLLHFSFAKAGLRGLGQRRHIAE